jgi:hypothetical protein
MTDRDHFAAAALTGLIVAMREEEEIGEICESAYGWADAMLRERAVTEPMTQPTLTDAEREAIEKAIGRELDAEWYGGPEPGRVVALRGLLERTK